MHELTHGTKKLTKLVKNVATPVRENNHDAKAIALLENSCVNEVFYLIGFFCLKY